MENKVTLYGASGHCKVIMDILDKNNVLIETIIDDDPNKKTLLGEQIVSSSSVKWSKTRNLILTVGNNAIRKKIAKNILGTFVNAVHPKAIIADFVTINYGTVIMAGAIINSDAIVGKHCIINSASVIEHDCNIGDFVHLSPNATLAGNVEVGEGSHIGLGALVIQGVKIGKWVTIGAGAVIIKDVPDYAVVVGNPGKIIKYNQADE